MPASSQTDVSLEALFEPFKLKSLGLKNRIVMAPMTRSLSPGGVPDQGTVAYYRRRAQYDVGLILSEGVAVDRPAARNDPNVPNFHGEKALASWAEVAREVKSAGGKMGPQLWHVGAVPGFKSDWMPPWPVDWSPGPKVEGPSGFTGPEMPYGNPMSDEDIADTIAAYAQAARDARRLGFDLVELHGAHGYLLDQFFWAATNLRGDRFGGDGIGQRARMAAEVVTGVRDAVGPDFPIIFRISQWKLQDFQARNASSPRELSEWLSPLVDAGIDAFHCSQRRFWEAEFPEDDGEEGLNLAGWAKKLTGAASITVGSVGLSTEFMGAFSGETSNVAGLDGLIRRLERGEFDLVAVGRALLNDPQWAHKIRAGALDRLRPFDPITLRSLDPYD